MLYHIFFDSSPTITSETTKIKKKVNQTLQSGNKNTVQALNILWYYYKEKSREI